MLFGHVSHICDESLLELGLDVVDLIALSFHSRVAELSGHGVASMKFSFFLKLVTLHGFGNHRHHTHRLIVVIVIARSFEGVDSLKVGVIESHRLLALRLAPARVSDGALGPCDQLISAFSANVCGDLPADSTDEVVLGFSVVEQVAFSLVSSTSQELQDLPIQVASLVTKDLKAFVTQKLHQCLEVSVELVLVQYLEYHADSIEVDVVVPQPIVIHHPHDLLREVDIGLGDLVEVGGTAAVLAESREP